MKSLYSPLLEFDAKQESILDNRILNPNKMTLREIGKKFKLSSERIRVIEVCLKRIFKYNYLLIKAEKVDKFPFAYIDEYQSHYLTYYWFNPILNKIEKLSLRAGTVFDIEDNILNNIRIKYMRKNGWGKGYSDKEISDFLKKIAAMQIIG